MLRGNAPWTFHHHPDHLQLIRASEAPRIDYPRPDGKITFDRLSSVFISNTNHEEDQPPHLRLRDPAKAIAVNYRLYDSPEQRYCPAGVYEIVRGSRDRRAAPADKRAELRPLQDLRHQGPGAEHRLGCAGGRRRAQLPEHVIDPKVVSVDRSEVSRVQRVKIGHPVESGLRRSLAPAWAVLLLAATFGMPSSASAAPQDKPAARTNARRRQDKRRARINRRSCRSICSANISPAGTPSRGAISRRAAKWFEKAIARRSRLAGADHPHLSDGGERRPFRSRARARPQGAQARSWRRRRSAGAAERSPEGRRCRRRAEICRGAAVGRGAPVHRAACAGLDSHGGGRCRRRRRRVAGVRQIQRLCAAQNISARRCSTISPAEPTWPRRITKRRWPAASSSIGG